ncbi:MAG: hypothetical protein HOC71_12510 [Candidatus Latescibacteria bacterium]|nr:hypothetical protein [Candidatus Latescibacterota bacterium]
MTVYLTGNVFHDSTLTDSGGNYSFSGLQEGNYTITTLKIDFNYQVSSSGFNYVFSPSSKKVSIKNDVVVEDIFVTALYNSYYQYVIGGRIFDTNGEPVEHVSIKCIDTINNTTAYDAHTDSEGCYRAWFEIKDKSYVLIPEKEGYEYTFSPDSCVVTIEENLNICNFTAEYVGPPFHTISGRLDGIDYEYLNDIWRIRLYDGANYYNSGVDSTECYNFSVLKDGIYTLIPDDIYPYTFDALTVTVEGEDVIIPDIILSYIGPTKYVFSGYVIDNSGNGIPGVNVLITLVGYLETNEEGYYSMSETNNHFSVDELDESKTISFIPLKNGFSFTPDTTYVTYEWQKGVEFAEIEVPDIIGFYWGAEDYFPLDAASTWIYERTIDGGKSVDHTVSVTGIETVNDKTYSLMSSGYSDYFTAFRIEKNTVNTHAEDKDKEYLKFGVERGSKWAITSIRGKILSATFIDIESVSVPAGTFEVCLHFELNLPLGNISYEKTDLWYARDVGLVRAEKTVVSMGEVMETVTDILKDYEIK